MNKVHRCARGSGKKYTVARGGSGKRLETRVTYNLKFDKKKSERKCYDRASTIDTEREQV